jgi:hypothetical protein
MSRQGGYVSRMNDRDKAILVNLASKMAARQDDRLTFPSLGRGF